MMIHKISVQLISLLTLLIAYIFTVTPAGYFRAWVAKKLGDETAEDLGFLSLDPIVHSDFIGLIVLAILGVGWGRHVPINPNNIHGRHRSLKLLAAFFSDVAAHLVLASLALFLFIALFGSHTAVVQEANLASLTLTTGRIVVSYIQLNVFLATVSLVVNGVALLFIHLSEKHSLTSPNLYYAIVLLPIFIFVIFNSHIQHAIMYVITTLSGILAHIFGAL